MIEKAILNAFQDRTILVTGGTGMIGRQVVRILSEAGARVRSISLDRLTAVPSVDHLYGDLTDFNFCKSVTKGADFVFHLAGIKGSVQVTLRQPASFFVPLLMMNTNVLEACRINGVKKVIYTSSIGAYAPAEIFKESDRAEEKAPMDFHPGWAKRMAELQIEAYRIQYGLQNFSVVRLCNVYGPGDNFDPDNAMVIPSLIARIHQGEDPVVVAGDGSAVRDFAYSEDVAGGIILALYHGTGPHFINLGSGRGYSIKEVVETLHDVTSFNHRFDSGRPSGFPKRVMDISLAKERLGYHPATPLREGLRKTWEWYVGNSKEHLCKVNYFKS